MCWSSVVVWCIKTSKSILEGNWFPAGSMNPRNDFEIHMYMEYVRENDKSSKGIMVTQFVLFLTYKKLGKCFAFAGFCWRKNIGLLYMVSVSLNDTRQILKYRTAEAPPTNKNSYPETDYSHMDAIIIWIGLITDITGLGDPQWDSHWPNDIW